MPTNFHYKLPDFGATFHVLKAEGIILTAWLRPHDESILKDRITISMFLWQRKSLTSLTLVDVVCPDGDLEKDLLRLFRFGNELRLSDRFIKLSRAKRRAEVSPVLTCELVDLFERRGTQ